MKPNSEQIKKAFEYCKNNEGECPKECPLFADTECTQTLGFYGLSLINSYERKIKELTEENERLKSEVSVKRKLLDKAEVRIDCLDEVNKVLKADICNATMNLEHITKENDRLKADTVREMQERLHERFKSDPNLVYSNYNIHRYIDQTAKEMESKADEV